MERIMFSYRIISEKDCDLTGLVQLALKINEDIVKAIVRQPEKLVGKRLRLTWDFCEEEIDNG